MTPQRAYTVYRNGDEETMVPLIRVGSKGLFLKWSDDKWWLVDSNGTGRVVVHTVDVAVEVAKWMKSVGCWNQPTPQMQAIHTFAGIDGWLSNVANGTNDGAEVEYTTRVMRDHMQWLLRLPTLEKWPE